MYPLFHLLNCGMSTKGQKQRVLQVGLNMCPLTTGEYTIVFELYFPSASINRSTVQIPAISNIVTVTRISTKTLSNHNRSITHLHKYNNVTPNYLLKSYLIRKLIWEYLMNRENEMLLILKRQFLTITI